MAQNIPDLLTVSLFSHECIKSSQPHGNVYICVAITKPAVDQYRMVASVSLNLAHLSNGISDTAKVGAEAIRFPGGYMYLGHLVACRILHMQTSEKSMHITLMHLYS